MNIRLIFSALFLVYGLLVFSDLTANRFVLLILSLKADEVLNQAIFPDSCKRKFNELMPLNTMITSGNVKSFLALLDQNFPTKNPKDLIKRMLHKDSKNLIKLFPEIDEASCLWKTKNKHKNKLEFTQLRLVSQKKEDSNEELVPQSSILNKVPESWEQLLDEE